MFIFPTPGRYLQTAALKVTTPPMHGTSGNLWLQLKSLAMLLTHTLKS